MIVRRLTLCAVMVLCLTLAGSAWAGSLDFNGTNFAGPGC